MAVQWHPLLARFLRHDYADRLEVQTEIPLGEMPLRADFLLIRRAPDLPLPFPLSHLGSTTLMEFKGPDETVSQKDLQLLGIYADLYVYREDLSARRDLTLWLVGSRFAEGLSDPERAYLAEPAPLGPGVEGGHLDGYPTRLVNLSRIPVVEELLCFLMVTKHREQQLAEFLLDRREVSTYYLTFMHWMHREPLEEVLAMRKMTPQELGIDAQALIEACGEDGIIDRLGPDRVLERLGADRVLQVLVAQLGRERVHQLVEQGASTSAA
jgi:hypothetical protein